MEKKRKGRSNKKWTDQVDESDIKRDIILQEMKKKTRDWKAWKRWMNEN